MRHPIVKAAVVAILLSGCQKERECNCDIKTTGTVTTRTTTFGFEPIVPGIDTTISNYYDNRTESVTRYKLRKRAMRANCPTFDEQNINEFSINSAPGLYTITTNDVGKRTTRCTIE